MVEVDCEEPLTSETGCFVLLEEDGPEMSIDTDSNPQPSMPGPYKIVAATSFGVFLSALDASIVNVSLVTMKDSLGVPMVAIQ